MFQQLRGKNFANVFKGNLQDIVSQGEFNKLLKLINHFLDKLTPKVLGLLINPLLAVLKSFRNFKNKCNIEAVLFDCKNV